MKKYWKKFLKFLYEMIPVMVGVYLAFALNTFSENRKLKAHQSNFEEMIKKEIIENQKSIDYAYDYHIELKQKIMKLKESEDIVKAMESFSFQGMRPGVINQSAFETGIQSGIVQEMDIEQIWKINKLYNLQKGYEKFTEAMISSLLNKNLPKSKSEIEDFLVSMIMNLNDMLSFEEGLQNRYNNILEEF